MGCTTFALCTAAMFLVHWAEAANDSCFGYLGCFSNGAPWTTLMRPMPPPKSPEVIDTRFYLYTRTAPDRFYVSNPSDGVYSVAGSSFDGSKPTVFIIHGFVQNGNDSDILGVKDAVIGKVDGNVIVVDWGKGSVDVTYFHVAANTRVAAAVVTLFLRHLLATQGVNVSRVHLIGFSLGAHIAGYVGKAVPYIARITALDAAQPAFEGYEKTVRLDVADAVFIDAIHTDGRPTVPLLGYGLMNPVGHVDFFVNGGWNQPACLDKLMPRVTSWTDLASASVFAIRDYIRCPHDRAFELFVASLTLPNCTFWGHQVNALQRALNVGYGDLSTMLWGSSCDKSSCSQMGFDSIHFPARGSFSVATSTTPPFCLADPKADLAMKPFFT